MKGTVDFKVGTTKYQLDIEEKSDAETLHKMVVYGNPPCFCHECKNKQYFRLDSHKGGEYFYTEVVCTKCGAKSSLTGKKDGSYYWKKFEKWAGGKTQDENSGGSQDDDNNDEIPF